MKIGMGVRATMTIEGRIRCDRRVSSNDDAIFRSGI